MRSKIFMLISLFALAITVAATSDFQLPEDLSIVDLKTVTTPTGAPFEFCWIQRPCADCVQPYNIQIRKYLAEGGQFYLGPLIHRDDWRQVNKDRPGEDPKFCVKDSLNTVGHWIYEARICGPDPNGGEPICAYYSSANPENSVLPIPDGEESTPWWIYGYLKAPGDIEL